MAKVFTQEVDFFSIGTNDLIQYTLAVDRSNERVASLYSAAHPSVLMLIKDVIRAAKRRNIDVTCCGEMAGEVEFVMMLLGMGLRKLSMTPSSIPEIKKLVRSVSIEQCERVARRAASYDSERQVLNYLREETRKIIPEAFDGRSIN
jgi:phosphotransferase system enzyme I (PtsI)